MAAADNSGHHALAVHEALLVHRVDQDHGLSSTEAVARLDRYGANRLPPSKRTGALPRLLRQFRNPLIYVLLTAFVVVVLLGELVDAVVIIAVVMVNAAVGYAQESKAQSALDALRRMVATTARVRRDGVLRQVDASLLVPGDVVAVESGDKIPADLRLLSGAGLRVDESALTGESMPVDKDESVLPVDTAVADRCNMLYSGTLVSAGSATGLVVATGAATELGEIHRLVGEADPLATPLTRRLDRFSRVLTAVILGLAAVTVGIGLTRGESWPDMFVAAVALAVGAIPEGLPAAVTITLAIGMSRMAQRRAIIRRLPAVETLGSTTVVCSDKTGTLTQNRMLVRAVVGSAEILGGAQASADDESRRWTLVAGALCNDAEVGAEDASVGDPTETALLASAAAAGLDPALLRTQHPRLDAVAFSTERRWMATSHGRGREQRAPMLLMKGAAEAVLGRCATAMDADGDTVPLRVESVLREVDRLASGGLRVLAMAVLPTDPLTTLDDAAVGGLTFVGLQAMADPPRPEAAAAVAACRTAGMAVKMITGDHPGTAAAIAAELGILELAPGGPGAGPQSPGVLTGVELAALTPEELPERVARTAVFARVSPQQKLLLVDALQARGQVVAMTGDGVNDAPALRQADIGVAMGGVGTEVAKEASDMVLTDDDFATIEAAIEEGRGVYDNLKKFIAWTLPTNMAEGLVILVAILLGTTLPILPVQILWINMTTAVLLGLTLAFEPKEAGIMRRPPIDPRRPLLDTDLLIRIGLVSAVLVAGASWLFQWELAAGAPVAEARTAALNLFVVVQIVYLFACRSLHRPVRALGWFSNGWLLIGVATQLLLQACLTYLPFFHQLFDTAPLSAAAWVRIAAVAVVAAAVVAVDKKLRPPRR